MWRLFEPLHAVTYFSAESADAYRAAGLKGFWMGYFAGRAAPMGPVGPAVVGAAFFNFAPRMPARALPDAWGFAAPGRVLEARLAGVDATLRRLSEQGALGPGFDWEGEQVRRAVDLARAAVTGLDFAGRPLAAANAARPWPAEPHLALWHGATVLREHRGDGHLAALRSAGLDGCQAHVSLVATGAVPRSVIQPARGWTDGEWDGAAAELARRGWMAADGTLTGTGAAVRRHVEDVTDELAADPWRRLGAERTEELAATLALVATAVAGSGLIPVPNPMGLELPG